MTLLLLIIIYIAFIGLGIPDSLIGSAWPAVYTEFQIPESAVSCITLLISGCTVLSSIFSARVLNRFGAAKVSAVSTAITALALLGFSFAPHLIWMCLLAIPLGLGAGAIDAGLNNYIALHYSASHMNFLHCFYGIGVSCSPFLMSLALSDSNWRNGYRFAFCIQIAITVILFLSLPLWKKKSDSDSEESDEPTQTLSLFEMVKMPTLRTAWIIMLATNAIEYACGVWGSTYLVEYKGFSPEHGALALTLYYAGMAMGRFLSGLLANKIRTWTRIRIGTVGVMLSVLFLLIPLPDMASVIGLCLIGLSNGSIYPNLIHLTPHNFGKEISQSVMGSQIATAYLGVMLAPPLFGGISALFGFGAYPVFLAALAVILAVSLVVFIRQLKKRGIDTNL